jgi:hypothetical protein
LDAKTTPQGVTIARDFTDAPPSSNIAISIETRLAATINAVSKWT